MANGPTGRRVKEPIADLVEWVHEGISHTLVVFHEDFRDDDAFGSGIAPIRDFLDKPCVMGITGLAEQPSAPGVFAYKTGVVRTVRELISIMADGDGAGWKASLELFHRAGRALLDAAEAGTVSGITNHGSLSPWRLVVNAKGGVEVIGYGLPALDVVDWVREPVPDMRPAVGTVRYLAPERCEGNAEDISTDLFVLALICAELATGKPVYGGTAKTVAGDASEGIAESLLKAPPNIQALFGRALKPWPNERWSDTGDLLSQVQGVADDLDGLDLAAVYAECLDYDSDVEIKLPKDWSIQGLSGASESASDDEDIDALCERIFAEAPKVGKQVDASGSWLDSAIEALDASNTDVKTLIAETNGLANLGADAADRADAIANEAEEAATLDQAQALWDEVEELSARAGKIDAEIRGLISKGLAVQDAAAVEALRVAAEEEADRIAAEEAQGAAEEEAKRIAAEEETARLAAEEASRIAEEARIAAEQEAARIAAEEEEAARIAAEEAAKAAEEEARIAAEEEEARIAAEEEAARIADEEEAARIAAEEARIAAEEEAARIAEEEEAARIAAEEEARIAAEEEAARIAAEEEEEAARIAAEEEAARIAAEEAAQAAEQEAARIAAEEEAERIAAEEAAQAAEEEAARIAAEEEAARIAAEEEAARIAAEEEARIAAEEEARIAAEEEAARIAAEEARIAAEDEAARVAAEEARIAAEDEAARIAAEEEAARIAAEEEARIAAEEEAARIAAEEARIAAEEEAARVAAEEARIAAEDEAARIAADEEAARIAAEEEAARIAAEEEAARIADEEEATRIAVEAAKIAAEVEARALASTRETASLAATAIAQAAIVIAALLEHAVETVVEAPGDLNDLLRPLESMAAQIADAQARAQVLYGRQNAIETAALAEENTAAIQSLEIEVTETIAASEPVVAAIQTAVEAVQQAEQDAILERTARAAVYVERANVAYAQTTATQAASRVSVGSDQVLVAELVAGLDAVVADATQQQQALQRAHEAAATAPTVEASQPLLEAMSEAVTTLEQASETARQLALGINDGIAKAKQAIADLNVQAEAHLGSVVEVATVIAGLLAQLGPPVEGMTVLADLSALVDETQRQTRDASQAQVECAAASTPAIALALCRGLEAAERTAGDALQKATTLHAEIMEANAAAAESRLAHLTARSDRATDAHLALASETESWIENAQESSNAIANALEAALGHSRADLAPEIIAQITELAIAAAMLREDVEAAGRDQRGADVKAGARTLATSARTARELLEKLNEPTVPPSSDRISRLRRGRSSGAGSARDRLQRLRQPHTDEEAHPTSAPSPTVETPAEPVPAPPSEPVAEPSPPSEAGSNHDRISRRRSRTAEGEDRPRRRRRSQGLPRKPQSRPILTPSSTDAPTSTGDRKADLRAALRGSRNIDEFRAAKVAKLREADEDDDE